MADVRPGDPETREDERAARWRREMEAWHREHGPERESRPALFSIIRRALRELFILNWR
jgi:hypothetical protein